MLPLIITLNMLMAGDAASTHVALNKGARETILTQNQVLNDVFLAGESVGVSYALLNASKTHPKAAKIVGWSFIAIRGAVVAHNLHVIQIQNARR